MVAAMTLSALRWFKAALVLQILLLAYWLTIEVVAIFPWNDLAARPAGFDLGRDIALNALQLLAYMALFAFGIQSLAVLSVLGYAAYLGWQLWIWWKPYFLGASSDWQALYATSYSHTLRALPDYGARLQPDAQHLALQALTLLTLIATIVAVARMRHL
jgi:hypothetical protein